jgi:hypothetical protein
MACIDIPLMSSLFAFIFLFVAKIYSAAALLSPLLFAGFCYLISTAILTILRELWESGRRQR